MRAGGLPPAGSFSSCAFCAVPVRSLVVSLRSLLPLALALAALPSGCASSSFDPPVAPPYDFVLQIRSRGATNPHCDYEVSLDATGRLAYAVEHLGRRMGDRRGETRVEAEAVRFVWRAVASSGVFESPAALPPQEGQDERGEVLYRVTAAGRKAEVLADRAGTPGLDRILAAVHRVVPWSAWQVPGGDSP